MLFALWMGLQGCDKEETKSGLKGSVSVEGTDADSVVVRLYNRPDIEGESSVWFVPSQHSSIGFTYQTQNAYDHRTDWHIAVDTTDAQGRFEFNNVNPGDYIVVADGDVPSSSNLHLKENYGWSRPVDVRVDNAIADVGTLQLLPDTVLGITTVGTAMTIPAGRHWVLRGNFIITSGGSVTVEPGAVIRIINNGRIQINAGGELICNGSPDNFILITTDDIVAQDPPQFSYCRIEYAQTAIETDAEGGEITNCFLKRSVESVRANRTPPLFQRNVVQRVGTGIHCGSTSDVSISNNLFQSCDPFSISLDLVNNGQVFCNWFRDGGGSDTSTTGGSRGVIKMDFVTDFQVFQNSFETSWYALSLGSGVDSTVRIHHNTFNRMHTVLYVGVTNDRLRRSCPRFNYNCLISVAGHYAWILSCQINTVDIHAENNYWNGVLGEQAIHTNLLWDCVRQPEAPVPCPCFLLGDIMSTCSQIEALTDTSAGICEDL
jgi:hypothetical protein